MLSTKFMNSVASMKIFCNFLKKTKEHAQEGHNHLNVYFGHIRKYIDLSKVSKYCLQLSTTVLLHTAHSAVQAKYFYGT